MKPASVINWSRPHYPAGRSGRSVHLVGTWLSLVEHSLGVRGVASSNLAVPTNSFLCLRGLPSALRPSIFQISDCPKALASLNLYGLYCGGECSQPRTRHGKACSTTLGVIWSPRVMMRIFENEKANKGPVLGFPALDFRNPSGLVRSHSQQRFRGARRSNGAHYRRSSDCVRDFFRARFCARACFTRFFWPGFK